VNIMAILGKEPTVRDDMSGEPDHGRRHFLSRTAMTIAAARFGLVGTSEAYEREPRQIAAFRRAKEWLNSPPLSAMVVLGKVVVVQFGTYSCINWLRTLPYVRAWNQKYGQGLVVIGVHTPEFTFEKKLENVHRAVKQMKLDFPIAVDNDYAIGRAFDNRYWPALYFIDARGHPRGHHFGEGEYERSERAIRELLAEAGVTGEDKGVVPIAAEGFELQADWPNLRSPEIYLGRERTANFSSPGGAALWGRRVYAVPTQLKLNEWALAGEWTMANEPTILSKAPGRVVCRSRSSSLMPASRHSRSRSADAQTPGNGASLTTAFRPRSIKHVDGCRSRAARHRWAVERV
jgi:thiol-disulfide isomerase/thioredoxin